MRRWTRWLVAAAACAVLTVPGAFAGWTALDLLASGTVSATGQGGSIAVGGMKELTVFVDCTTNTGTGKIDVYLQTSSDNGVTWYDLPYTLGIKTNTAAAETTATTSKRDILDDTATCSAGTRAEAHYTVFGNYIRAAYVVTVTSAPTYTFSVKAIGKS